MQILKLNQDIRPLSEVRTGIASFIKQVHDIKRPLVITQHSKGVAILLDIQEFEIIQEKFELLSDIQKAIVQIENGQGIDHPEAKAGLLKWVKK